MKKKKINILEKYPNAELDSTSKTKLWYDSESLKIIETDLNDIILKEVTTEEQIKLEEELLNEFDNLLNDDEDEY